MDQKTPTIHSWEKITIAYQKNYTHWAWCPTQKNYYTQKWEETVKNIYYYPYEMMIIMMALLKKYPTINIPKHGQSNQPTLW